MQVVNNQINHRCKMLASCKKKFTGGFFIKHTRPRLPAPARARTHIHQNAHTTAHLIAVRSQKWHSDTKINSGVNSEIESSERLVHAMAADGSTRVNLLRCSCSQYDSVAENKMTDI